MTTPGGGLSGYGVPIRSRSHINNLCVQTLRPLLGNPSNLRLDGEAPERGQSEVFLNSAASTTGLAERRYPVLPLLVKGAFTYWLALAVTLLRERDLFVTSASLLVFEGPPRDPDKSPLFRAEWHEWKSVSKHAQPHWHVYPSVLAVLGSWLPEAFVAQTEDSRDFGGEEPRDSADAAIGLQPKLAEFHYAMSANWHLPGGAYQQSLATESSLSGWLRGCVSYSYSQLDYLTR